MLVIIPLLFFIHLTFISTVSSHVSQDYLDVCGWTWQEEYISMHKSVTQNKKKSKYIVAFPLKAGLADNILGYVTSFLWALLTQRTFLIVITPEVRAIDLGYHSPHVNWTAPHIPRPIYECLLPPYKNYSDTCAKNMRISLHASDGLSVRSLFARNINENTPTASLKYGNMDTIVNEDVIIYLSNRGGTFSVFDNPLYKDLLMNRYNLTRHTAFPCLFNFLFKIKHEEACLGRCKETEKKLRMATDDPNTLTIAIHMRRSDGAARNDAVDTDFFRCARSLMQHHRTSPEKKVVILFVSSHMSLQKAAVKEFGDDVLLPSGIPSEPESLDTWEGAMTAEEIEHLEKKGVLDSARDFYLMSMADVHLLSRDSGFGVVGAMTRLTSKHVLHMVRPSLGECRWQLDGDPLGWFANSWSRI